MEIMHSSSWRRIEVVITGLTRNQVVLTGSWVRIPPSPPAGWVWTQFAFKARPFLFPDTSRLLQVSLPISSKKELPLEGFFFCISIIHFREKSTFLFGCHLPPPFQAFSRFTNDARRIVPLLSIPVSWLRKQRNQTLKIRRPSAFECGAALRLRSTCAILTRKFDGWL